MKNCLLIVAMSILSFLSSGSNAQSIKNAGDLFRAGRFIEAEKEYTAVLEKEPENLKSLVYLGYITLLENRLDESEQWLLKARTIQPKLPPVNEFLSEIYYRRDDFQKSAPFYRAMGKEAMAMKLECFRELTPYRTDNAFDEIKVDFIVTDPLPVVRVTINEKHEGYFFIDTGGGELILDEEYAKKVQAETFGYEASSFAANKKAPFGHGKISSVTLGDQTIKNIPVMTLDLNQLELGGIKIDGAIGTVFLYHFLSTIDYKNNQLILRNRLKFNSETIIQPGTSTKVIPFTMAGDHFMFTRGTINNSDTMLFFVDTGLAGYAFTGPKLTLKKAGINYEKDKKTRGLGGGGYFNTYPFHVDRICINNLCIENLHGQYGPFPSQIERSFGFDVDGLVSHEFFRKHSLTIDFVEMKYLISD